MATTDQELKQLNKTVSDAVNILKAWVGSSAQAKNMNEEQRKLINKWFEVANENQETQKRQRAFTERERDAQGRFIRKQERSTERSTNTFMKMAMSVKGMFSKMTTGIIEGISNFTQGIANNFSKFFQAVKTQFLNLFGEESEWFEILGSIKDSIVNMGTGIFEFLFRRTPSWAKKQIGVLKDLYKLKVKEMKRDFLDASGKKTGKLSVMGMVGALVFAIGAGIGAFLHRYFILLTKLPFFAKIGKLFRKIDDIPYIGKLFKAVKFGFKWLGWPLTLLMSVIDSIKGFKDTEGSLWEKIKGGLWEALSGFIELPVKFIGWVSEKVLGFFGVEVDSLSQKMMGGIKKLFDMVFEGWELIFGILRDTFTLDNLSKAWEWVKNIPGIIKDKISSSIDYVINTMGDWNQKLADALFPIINGAITFFNSFWNLMVGWIASKIPSWLPGGSKITETLKNMQVSTPTTSPVESSMQTDRMKIKNQTEQQKETTEGIKKLNESVDRSTTENKNAINSIVTSNQGGGGTVTEREQIKDELDNTLVGLSVYGGA